MGLLASISLAAFYFIVSTLLGGLNFAISNFASLWYWMLPLIAGFGIQIGLFFYVKDKMHKTASAHAAASTGISATAMVACCAHHIADIAPFLGITALGLFLSKYQSVFLLAGILSNILGILYMANLATNKIPKAKANKIFYSLLALSIIIVAAFFVYASQKPEKNDKTENKERFNTLTSSENNVEFSVTPLSASEFDIEISTHSVELDFELTEISALYDDLGNTYKPLKWEGSPPGGHHRSGILNFPEASKSAGSIKLAINDGVEREFVWGLE